MSTAPKTVNVDLNETGDEMLHRGITVSEEFDHPYLNNTHRAISYLSEKMSVPTWVS